MNGPAYRPPISRKPRPARRSGVPVRLFSLASLPRTLHCSAYQLGPVEMAQIANIVIGPGGRHHIGNAPRERKPGDNKGLCLQPGLVRGLLAPCKASQPRAQKASWLRKIARSRLCRGGRVLVDVSHPRLKLRLRPCGSGAVKSEVMVRLRFNYPRIAINTNWNRSAHQSYHDSSAPPAAHRARSCSPQKERLRFEMLAMSLNADTKAPAPFRYH